MEQMKAGRELDALIAEKVMGWALKPWPPTRILMRETIPGVWDSIPPYSTDIAAALSVVDHIWKQGITNPFSGLFDQPLSLEAMALEICLRAIKAVGAA